MAVYCLDDDSFEFPPAEDADPDDGLLAIGGDFHPERLLNAYAGGIFPWPVAEGEPITWFSPDPRFVLKAADLHIPKSLAKTLRKGLFEYRVDTAFPEMIYACAAVPRPNQELPVAMEKPDCKIKRSDYGFKLPCENATKPEGWAWVWRRENDEIYMNETTI
jgi:hypothetical protein